MPCHLMRIASLSMCSQNVSKLLLLSFHVLPADMIVPINTSVRTLQALLEHRLLPALPEMLLLMLLHLHVRQAR